MSRLVTAAKVVFLIGLPAGLVATSSVTDATPASFAAHISLRMCENPDRMDRVEISGIYLGNCQQDKKAAGGPGSIAEQLAGSDVDLILGGGARHFDPRAEGEDVSLDATSVDTVACPRSSGRSRSPCAGTSPAVQDADAP